MAERISVAPSISRLGIESVAESRGTNGMRRFSQ